MIGGGDQPDWTGSVWAAWWSGKALSLGQSPFVATWNWFPVGQRQLGYYNLLDAICAAPLVWGLGPVVGYNLWALLLLWTNSLAMGRLAREAGASAAAAWVAGLGWMLSTYTLLELEEGRLSQLFLAPFLLTLLGVDRLARGRTGRWLPVGVGLGAAATALTYWFYGLFLAFAAAPLVLAAGRGLLGRRGARLGLAAGVAGLVLAPFFLDLALGYGAQPGVQRPLDGAVDYGAYDRGEFSLMMAIRWSLPPVWPLVMTASAGRDHRIALLLLALALGGLAVRPGGRWRWAAVAGLGWVLALGPYLRGADGAPRPYGLPYLFLYDHLPFFARLWWPERWTLLCWVGVCVLSALHLDLLLARIGRWRGAAVALCALALVWDLRSRDAFAPLLISEPPAVDHAFYAQIDGPVLTTPVLGDDAASRFLLWAQVWHGQPILSGLGAHLEGHRPPGVEAAVQANALLRLLSRVGGASPAEEVVGPADLAALRDQGFRWVVVDPIAYSLENRRGFETAYAAILSQLWGDADVTGQAARAWRLRPIQREIRLRATPVRAVAPPTGGPATRFDGAATPGRSGSP